MLGHGLCCKNKPKGQKERVGDRRESAPQSFACKWMLRIMTRVTKKGENLNLCHERFDRMKEFPGRRMGYFLQVKPPLEDRK